MANLSFAVFYIFADMPKNNMMKTKCSLILGSLLFISVSLFAQDKTMKAEKPAKAADAQPSEKEMQAWMAYMTPGEMHKMMLSANGEWHEELTFWMTMGGPATKAESSCTNSMIFGDRYQESYHKGEMMGMPFEGKSTLGYDNSRKVFQSTWIDNMGTGIMYLEGKWDEKKHAINFTGVAVDPNTGKTEKVREIFTFVDEKTQTMDMFSTKEGKEYKSMEIKFTKR